MKRFTVYSLCFLGFTFGAGIAQAQTKEQNYILSRDYKQTGSPGSDVSKVNIQVQYLDGLGRPLQSVAVGKSTSGSDIIQPVEYDGLGRQSKSYLPYAAGGNGAFQDGAVSAQSSFYTNNGAQLESSDLGHPFTETLLEASPASRPLGQQAMGNKSKSSAAAYGTNAGNEVKRYTYTANSEITNTINQNGDYPAGGLFKKQIVDENGKIAVEFTDKAGRIILKKVGDENLSTYYVYDDFGLLRAVLQPQLQESSATIADFAFLYNYDARGRVITKKIPGAGKVDMVYDNYDRLVMSQDANQLSRAGGPFWTFIKYDAFDRKIIDGEVASGTSRADWQSSFNGSAAHHENKESSIVGYSLGNTLPSVSDANVLNVTYYDDYSFNGSQGYVDVFGVTANENVKSKQTGNRTRMLTSGAEWLVSTTRYDAEYRPIQTVRQLYDLGSISIERVSTKYKYDLAAVVDQERTDHGSSSAATNYVLKTFFYDHADRLLSVKEKISINGGAKEKEAVTVAQRYNVLGDLKQKWFHSDDAVKFRRRTDYTSNIRGWTTTGNSYYLKQENGPDSTFFAYGLNYDNGSNYTNGNISQMQWRNKAENSYTKGVSFSYDGANRLAGSSGMNNYADLENGITYDKNGNLLTLVRNGFATDNLSYHYSGNRLASINDNSGNNTGVKSGESSFLYDGNGNMTTDNGRGAVLTYNYLNLPKNIVISGKTLTYDYDASGNKHKYVADTLTVKYGNGFEYNQNNAFSRLSLSEGQAVIRRDTIRFDYYIKDHLGNVRVVFDEKGKVLQKTDYYPFGLSVSRDGTVPENARNGINRYGFQGQEKQIGSDYVQFKWRLHDPLTGRFLSIDPLAEKYPYNSTFAFSENKVVGHIELEGLESVSAIVLSKAQNTWTGITNKISGAANTAASYLNESSNAISNALTSIDGIAFYSTNHDIKGKGSGMRQSQFPTGQMVEIDPILGAAGAATADPSKALIGGATVLGKITGVIEMLKEALGFGQSTGDAFNAVKSAIDEKKSNDKDKSTNKISSEQWSEALNKMSTTPGWTSAGSGLNKDSTEGYIDYYNGTQKVKSDTIRPNSNQ